MLGNYNSMCTTNTLQQMISPAVKTFGNYTEAAFCIGYKLCDIAHEDTTSGTSSLVITTVVLSRLQ